MVVDKNGTRIDQGDEVQWCDPEEEARYLERIWTVKNVTRIDQGDEIQLFTMKLKCYQVN